MSETPAKTRKRSPNVDRNRITLVFKDKHTRLFEALQAEAAADDREDVGAYVVLKLQRAYDKETSGA